MFGNCYALSSIDVSGWNTAKVTNFYKMFSNCYSLTSIDISSWDMSLATATNSTGAMFSGCYGLTSLTVPASLSRVDDNFAVFGGSPPAIAVYNFYRATAPTVSGTPFGNYAKPLHVPVSNSGYNVAPWTNTAIFSSIINDL